MVSYHALQNNFTTANNSKWVAVSMIDKYMYNQNNCEYDKYLYNQNNCKYDKLMFNYNNCEYDNW